MSPRGGEREGAGRKPLAPNETTIKTTITLPESVYNYLKELGGGDNVSKGVRLAVGERSEGDKDITSQVSTGGYDEEMVTLTKCICGQTFPSWEFVIDIYREWAKECPNCKRKLYCSIGIRVYEVVDE